MRCLVFLSWREVCLVWLIEGGWGVDAVPVKVAEIADIGGGGSGDS